MSESDSKSNAANEDDEVAKSAELARAQAEARRQRVLSKAKNRIGLVSGEQVATEETEEDKAASASKAARIKAARARRFGKKKANTSEEASSSTLSSNNESTTTKEEEEQNNNNAADEGNEQNTDEKSPMQSDRSMPSIEGGDGDDDNNNDDNNNDDSTTSTKKKYLGVAKMRRQKILEKKQKEAAEGATDGATSSSSSSDIKKAAPPPPPLKSKIPILPVIMHIITIFLLFAAGFDIGLQQYPHDELVIVHHQNVVEQYGLPLVHRALQVDNTKQKMNKNGWASMDNTVASDFDSKETEFDDFQVDEDGDGATKKEPVIDPLFQVDLDALTAGPGLINQMARGAVMVHRAILQLLFSPVTLVQTLIQIPQALVQTPPVLCLVALFIRQVIGKLILGATIPQLDDDSKKNSVGALDIMAMAKNYISSMLSTMFPTVVGLYDAFAHLRTDMYIMLCGLFCGLIWNMQISTSMDATTTSTNKAEAGEL